MRITVRSLKREGEVCAVLKERAPRRASGWRLSLRIWKTMQAGRKRWPDAIMCCTWRRRNEIDWTDPHGADVLPYAKSKTLAEHAAWDFIGREGRRLKLSVINPAGVFGPVLGPDYATSILIVHRMMDGAMPGVP